MHTVNVTDALRAKEEAYAVLAANPSAKVLLYFYGGPDAETGAISWCGDCVKTKAPVENALASLSEEQSANLYVLHVSLERPLYRDRAAFTPRRDETIHLEAIPNLIHVASTEPRDAEERLIEGELADQEKVRQFLIKVVSE
eukprot:ANDGO_01951.mRNA.1 hypothetical protein